MDFEKEGYFLQRYAEPCGNLIGFGSVAVHAEGLTALAQVEGAGRMGLRGRTAAGMLGLKRTTLAAKVRSLSETPSN